MRIHGIAILFTILASHAAAGGQGVANTPISLQGNSLTFSNNSASEGSQKPLLTSEIVLAQTPSGPVSNRKWTDTILVDGKPVPRWKVWVQVVGLTLGIVLIVVVAVFVAWKYHIDTRISVSKHGGRASPYSADVDDFYLPPPR